MPCSSAPYKLTIVSWTPPIVSDIAVARKGGGFLDINGLKIREIIEGHENASDEKTIKLKYNDIDDKFFYYCSDYSGFTSSFLNKPEMSKYRIPRSKSSDSPLVASFVDCINNGGKPKHQRKSRRKSRKSKQTRRK
jgi:hypothetical protein